MCQGGKAKARTKHGKKAGKTTTTTTTTTSTTSAHKRKGSGQARGGSKRVQVERQVERQVHVAPSRTRTPAHFCVQWGVGRGGSTQGNTDKSGEVDEADKAAVMKEKEMVIDLETHRAGTHQNDGAAGRAYDTFLDRLKGARGTVEKAVEKAVGYSVGGGTGTGGGGVDSNVPHRGAEESEWL